MLLKEEPHPFASVWPGKVWALDASEGDTNAIIDSTRIYQGLYQWAANTGQKIVPDSAGTSPTGSYRRNAQQISSALRLQSAEHFIPTQAQLGLMFPEINSDSEKVTKWLGSDLEEKVGGLALAEVGFVEQLLPDLVSLSYDPNTDSFLGEGAPISRVEARERLDNLLANPEAQDPTDPIRIGEATLVRYLAARSALQGSFRADAPVLRSESTSLDQIAYSRARGRVTPQQDTAHVDLARRFRAGDEQAIDEARKLVTEVARGAGWSYSGFHDTKSKERIVEFLREKLGSNTKVPSAGMAGRQVDGIDLLPLLRNQTKSPPDSFLYYSFDGVASAYRKGDWKLILPVRSPTLSSPRRVKNISAEISPPSFII